MVDRKQRSSFGQGRQKDSSGNAPGLWSLILVLLGAFVLSAKDWELAGTGWGEAVMVPFMVVLCLAQCIQWYGRGMKWLPLGEAYLVINLIFYGFPSLYGDLSWLDFPSEQRFWILFAAGVFLLSFFVTYNLFLHHRKLDFQPGGVLVREIRSNIVWFMFACWGIWYIGGEEGWLGYLPIVGDNRNIFQAVIGACGSISIVYLCYQLGLKKLPSGHQLLLILGLLAGLIASFASGFLVTGVGFMAAAAFAFFQGRKRVPLFTVACCAIALTVLQAGKSEYRADVWDDGKNYSTRQDLDLSGKYALWLSYSWKNLTREHQKNNDDQSDLFQRASLLHVLAVVMDTTPGRLPYLDGITYEILPQMLMPRYFWNDKPRGSLPTEFLAVRYGLQSWDGVDTTSVSVGPLAEAWANFGWFGMILGGVFFGVLFGIPARMSSRLMPRQVGWLLASVFLLYSIDVSHTVVEICCSLSQGLFMGLVLLTVVSQKRIVSARPVRDFGQQLSDLLHPFRKRIEPDNEFVQRPAPSHVFKRGAPVAAKVKFRD